MTVVVAAVVVAVFVVEMVAVAVVFGCCCCPVFSFHFEVLVSLLGADGDVAVGYRDQHGEKTLYHDVHLGCHSLVFLQQRMQQTNCRKTNRS